MAVILSQYLGKQAKIASAFGGIIQVALRATFQVKSEHSEGANGGQMVKAVGWLF